ncbi:MAG: ABC transporter ATP-binding protein [Acetatifactor sp.]|nr:ABC transporter ATP-binding protein [Acetatifactor sp.]
MVETSEDMIVCDGIVKIYKTDEIEVMALQGLDLTVKKGELVSIIGKSGSGKSTLMNMIGGLETPTLGKLLVAGRNIGELGEKEMVEYRKKTVGFVWQKSARNLFPYLTSLENVVMAMSFTDMSGKEKKARAMKLLEMASIDHKKDSYPGQMSGGEQQRVSIAVALANDPAILLADEPTGAVDTRTADLILQLFRRVNQELGTTIIIVTHDRNLADKSDRVLMISDGKISTEKIMKEKYRQELLQVEKDVMLEDSHEEYSVLDRAHRVQLTAEMLEAAGITSNKVKIQIEDGKVIIRGESE